MDKLKYEYLLIVLGMSMLIFTLNKAWKSKKADAAATIQCLQTKETLGKMLQEINEAAEDLVGEIESKSKNLEDLLMQAEEKEEALHELVDKSNKIFLNTKNEAAIHFEPSLPVFEKKLAPEHRYQAVYQLAQEGFDLKHIAKTLQMGQGEVELILNLKDIHMRH